MSKPLKIFLIACGVILVLWIIGRLTNTFQFYTSPTEANEPTLKKGKTFFASILKTPKQMDFICFYGEVPGLGRITRVYRLCGVGGDLVEIRNGELFVNNISFDNKISLQHNYIISRQEFEKIKDELNIPEESIQYQSSDTLTVAIADKFILENKIIAKRVVYEKNYEDPEIYKVFSMHWNQDNFGPITVPQNKYFVLGDNRQNALDSRYSGFIDKSDYIATVLWK